MPKLSSGRCVGIEQTSLRNLLDGKSDPQVLYIVVGFRQQIRNAADLLQFCRVLNIVEDANGRVPGSEKRTGFTVRDVQEGSAGWSESEVAEFSSWLAKNTAVQQWLQEEFTAIQSTIESHPIWKSDFMLGE